MVNPELSSPESAWCERSGQAARGGQCPLHGGDACLITLTGLWRKAFPASSGPPAGEAAPPEPDFQTAAQALISVQNVALLARMAGRHQESADLEFCEKAVRATLDQAEAEIARLREENAAARCEALALFNAMDHGPAEPLDTVAGIISQISNMVAGLRPPVETAQTRETVTPGVEALHRWITDECQANRGPAGAAREAVESLYDETLAAMEGWAGHRGVRYHLVLTIEAPSVSPSVPKEEDA